MNLEQIDLEEIVSYLESYFTKEAVNALGRETRFVQRSTSRIDSMTFLLLNVFNSSSGMSLNDSCDWLEDHFNISMTKQSLDERYNTYAVSFMKRCFEQLLSKMNQNSALGLSQMPFSCIQITDSTSFKIPSDLASFYKGYKGNGGEAVIKLHLNYDLQTGLIADISIGDGCVHDNSYNFGKEEVILKDGLYLRDLGYYSFKYFEKLDKAKAYFISRAKTNASFYFKANCGDYERIELSEYFPLDAELVDLPEVYLGSRKEKIKLRLVLEKVPEEVAQKRLAQLKKYAKKQKDKTVSEQWKRMCHFNVFISNVPKDKIAANAIRSTYSLRWQIELMFKIWKSHYDIDKFHKMSIFRFETYLYARLIAVLIDCSIQNSLRPIFMDEFDFELSVIKASKHIKKTL